MTRTKEKVTKYILISVYFILDVLTYIFYVSGLYGSNTLLGIKLINQS